MCTHVSCEYGCTVYGVHTSHANTGVGCTHESCEYGCGVYTRVTTRESTGVGCGILFS